MSKHTYMCVYTHFNNSQFEEIDKTYVIYYMLFFFIYSLSDSPFICVLLLE